MSNQDTIEPDPARRLPDCTLHRLGWNEAVLNDLAASIEARQFEIKTLLGETVGPDEAEDRAQLISLLRGQMGLRMVELHRMAAGLGYPVPALTARST